MFARFDENPAMTLQDIKETKRYRRTQARRHGQRENSIPKTNKVWWGGIIIKTKSLLPAVALTTVLLKGSAKLGVLPSNILLVLKKIENKSIAYSLAKFGHVDHQSLHCNAFGSMWCEKLMIWGYDIS